MADKKLREWAKAAHKWIVWADGQLKGGAQTQDDGPGGLPPPPPPPPPPGGDGEGPGGG